MVVEDRDKRGSDGHDPGLVALADQRGATRLEVHPIEADDGDLARRSPVQRKVARTA